MQYLKSKSAVAFPWSGGRVAVEPGYDAIEGVEHGLCGWARNLCSLFRRVVKLGSRAK